MAQNYPFDKQYDAGEGITFNEVTGILSGDDDPKVTDITDGRNDIPISTIYIRTGQATPEIYVKSDTGVNDWAFASLVGSNNGSGLLGIGDWRYDTNTTPPPNDKRFSFNNSDITQATELYIDYQNNGGADLTNILNAVTPPALIYAQRDNDATDGFIARITAVASGATNVTYTVADVTFLTLGGSLSTTRGYNMIVSGLGGSGSAIDIQEDDVTIVGSATTLNFEGNLVGLIDEGGGKVTASFALDVQEEDVSVNGDASILNFVGRQFNVSNEGGGKVTISIGMSVSDHGVEVQADVSSLDIIGPATITDEGDGALTLDTNVAMEEIENVDLTGLSADDSLKFDSGSGTWKRIPAPPPAPPGTNAIVQFVDDTVDVLSGTTTIPKDSSLPQLSEGSEVWTVDFTPVQATSKIRITNSFTLSSSAQNMELVFSLFEDTVCKGTVVGATVEKDSGQGIAFTFVLPSPGTDLVVYSLRIGKVVGQPGSWFVNQISGLADGFGDTLDETGFSITELAILGT